VSHPEKTTIGQTTKARPGFVSAHPLAMLVILLLMLSCVVAAIAICSQIMRLSLDRDAFAQRRYVVILFLQIVLFGAAAAAFCLWVHRAYRNLTVIELKAPKLTAARALEGFFIPIINFYHPLQVLEQLWSGSSHSGRERSPILLMWWLAFLGSWLVTLVASMLGLMQIWGEVTRVAWSIVSQVLWLACGVLGVMIVRGIDIMQKERVQMVADLTSGPAVPVAAPPPRASKLAPTGK
jgi:hypothetical protein